MNRWLKFQRRMEQINRLHYSPAIQKTINITNHASQLQQCGLSFSSSPCINLTFINEFQKSYLLSSEMGKLFTNTTISNMYNQIHHRIARNFYFTSALVKPWQLKVQQHYVALEKIYKNHGLQTINNLTCHIHNQEEATKSLKAILGNNDLQDKIIEPIELPSLKSLLIHPETDITTTSSNQVPQQEKEVILAEKNKVIEIITLCYMLMELVKYTTDQQTIQMISATYYFLIEFIKDLLS